MIKTERFLIAKGNPTLLVEGYTEPNRAEYARQIITDGLAEQVGFSSIDTDIPTLEMMGNELCVNAIVAFAAKLGGSGQLKASGLNEAAEYQNCGSYTTVAMRLNMAQPDRDTVLFDGIGYKYMKSYPSVDASELRSLARKYNKPAFGLAIYDNCSLTPCVYVAKTDTIIWETACGSGSIAVLAALGRLYMDIRQMSGAIISVYKDRKGRFTVNAQVDKIKSKQ